MPQPTFLWDKLKRLLWGALALPLLLLFWVVAVVFLIGNLVVAWHRLWRYLGVWNLVAFRFLMRMRNLYDLSRLVLTGQRDPREFQWDPRYRYQRTVDGTFNDLTVPAMGSAGTPFGRNFPPKRLKKPDGDELVDHPSPREVSRKLLTRDRFRPATTLNLLAAAWIQFQVHDWFNHMRKGREDAAKIRLEKDDKWPPEGTRVCSMEIRLSEEVPDKDKAGAEEFKKADVPKDFPIYRNTETHWWDGSQIYGSTPERQNEVRCDRDDPRNDPKDPAYDSKNPVKVKDGKLYTKGGRLPKESDPDRQGIDLTGFNDNWWIGLSLFHTLFALEHNAICDELHRAYPDWEDERLFQTARLINTMLMAKIHTIEWTPAILGHPTLRIGMYANWEGILGRLNKVFGRIKLMRGIQEEVTGIPGSETDHHAAPYCMTEEFASVYRLHPLIPDDYRFYSAHSDELLKELDFDQIQGNSTRPTMQGFAMKDLFYSFGVAHPGAITLHNFPRALQRFKRIKDLGGKIKDEFLDLAAVDIFRDRERAVPRYNLFRRLLLRFPATSYRRLVGLPLLFPSLSGLSRREMEERKEWVGQLEKLYGPNHFFAQLARLFGLARLFRLGPSEAIDRLDTMVGLTAEYPPKGFGFSDTAFRIFVLMASRRLKSDRFFTDDFKPEVYTEVGVQWINENGLKSMLQRHYPTLSGAMADVENPFAPWKRIERPSPEPSQAYPFTFTIALLVCGAVTGGLFGWLVELFARLHGPHAAQAISLLLDTMYSWTTLGGMAVGFCVGALCQVIVHFFDNVLGRRLTVGGLAAIVNFFIVVGAIYGSYQSGFGTNVQTLLASFATGETLKDAAIGAGVGLVLVAAARVYELARNLTISCEAVLSPLFRAFPWILIFTGMGAAIGWLVGAHWSYPQWGALAGALVGVMFALPRIRRIPIGAIPGAALGCLLGALAYVLTIPAVHELSWTDVVNDFTNSGILWWALLIALVVAADRGLFAAIPGFVLGWLAGGAVSVIADLFAKGLTIAEILRSFISSQAGKGALLGALLGVLLTVFVWRFRWLLRRWLWNLLALMKFVANKPLEINLPWQKRKPIGSQSLTANTKGDIPLDDIQVADHIPTDEKICCKTRYWIKMMVFPFQRWAFRWLPPMQEELPPIQADPQKALDHAYRGFRRRRYDPPLLPPEFEGSPDLGGLAVRGPYACYVRAITQGTHKGSYEWNLRDPHGLDLDRYETYPGLYKLGVRVLFRVDGGRLHEAEIESAVGISRPGDPNWQLAKKLALCALSNHMSLVRHWNWVHLTPTAHLAIATRNHLIPDHPIGRLLWPHVFGTVQSNVFGNMAQLYPGGDFEHIFSFTYKGMSALLRDTYNAYQFVITYPKEDAKARGIDKMPGDISKAAPTQYNLQQLFDVFLEHTTRYVAIYYADDPAVRQDAAIVDWLTQLNHLIPNGTGYKPDKLTRDDLARLLARFIYLVTAQHETVGAFLWNYQLWTHRQPVRVYKDGRREPLDVYQRLVNYNYLLNVNRTQLVADYSKLAEGLPRQDQAKAAFTQFKEDLETLEKAMREEPWAVWKIYPTDLEAHINA